jgi:hypothetical protein
MGRISAPPVRNLALLTGPLCGNNVLMSDVDIPEVNPDAEPGERLEEALRGADVDDVQNARGELIDDVDDEVDENGNINDDDPDL